MATGAVAQDAVRTLRHKIAKMEGRLAETLDQPPEAEAAIGNGSEEALLFSTGAARFDRALGGGLLRGALTEIHAVESRDAGLSAGFAMAMASRTDARRAVSILWIGTSEIFHEAGFPYAVGLAQCFGLSPNHVFLAETTKLADALWVAEEAAQVPAFSCVILEQRGNSDRLDLTATRRLHRRAAATGRPIILLRQAAFAEPTAAPLRLVVSPAPATPRATLAGPLPGTIGAPAFLVAIGKNRAAPAGPFTLEWKSHDRAFEERRPAHPRHLVSLPRDRADLASKVGAVLAFPPAQRDAAGDGQPAGGKHPEDRRPRRAG